MNFKQILKKIWHYIKLFLTTIFSFLISIFAPKTKSKITNKQKPEQKKEIETNNTKQNTTPITSNESPSTLKNNHLDDKKKETTTSIPPNENLNTKKIDSLNSLEQENNSTLNNNTKTPDAVKKTLEQTNNNENQFNKKPVIKPNYSHALNSENKPKPKDTIKPLKDLFVVELEDGNYILIDKDNNILTTKFPYKIVDYINHYVKVEYQDHYIIYDFKGNLIDKNTYKDIKLYEDFYATIDDFILLNIKKYDNPEFNLSDSIPLDKDRYKDDYKITKTVSHYEIKVKSSNKTYKANHNGIIEKKEEITEENNVSETLDEPKVITPPLEKKGGLEEISENETSLKNVGAEFVKPIDIPDSEKTLDNNTPEIETIEIPSTIIENTIEVPTTNIETEPKKEQEQYTEPNPKEKDKENTPPPKEVIDYELLKTIDKELNTIHSTIELEEQKEDLEDKNYKEIEIELNNLLEKIAIKKNNTKSKEEYKELTVLENKIYYLKNNLTIKKQNDIKKEANILLENIKKSEIDGLTNELKKLYFENQEDINEALTVYNNIELEKKLLKLKLKKACLALYLPTLLSFPFIHNKYFRFLAGSLLVSSHLTFFNHILNHKQTGFIEIDSSNLKKGEDALNDALNMTEKNIAKLEKLDLEARTKYPELNYDQEYITYLNNLKSSLLKEQEKMLKKEQLINKYNLSKNRSRKRERDI